MWIFLGLKWKLPFFRPNFVSSVSPLHLLEQQMTELRDDRASPHLCSRARSCPNNTRTPGCRRDFWAAKCNEIMTGCRGETLMCPRARATSVPAPPPHKLALVLLHRGKHCTTRPSTIAELICHGLITRRDSSHNEPHFGFYIKSSVPTRERCARVRLAQHPLLCCQPLSGTVLQRGTMRRNQELYSQPAACGAPPPSRAAGSPLPVAPSAGTPGCLCGAPPRAPPSSPGSWSPHPHQRSPGCWSSTRWGSGPAGRPRRRAAAARSAAAGPACGRKGSCLRLRPRRPDSGVRMLPREGLHAGGRGTRRGRRREFGSGLKRGEL